MTSVWTVSQTTYLKYKILNFYYLNIIIMEGGKIKGKGAYGCVFQPSLECKYPNETEKNKNYISKLVVSNEAQKELRISKFIENNLPNYEKYALIWEKNCTPSSKQIDKDLHKCNFAINIRKKNNDYSLLVAQYGGTTFEMKINSLIRIIKKNKLQNFKNNYINFIKETEGLFLGVKEFYENNFIHNDIKELNILKLVKSNDSLKKGVRFIDFGLSAVIPKDNNFLKERSYSCFNEPRWYYIYPPEYLYCMANTFELEDEYDKDSYKKRMLYNDIRDVHVKIVHTCRSNKEFDDRIKNIILKAKDGDYNSNDTLYEIFMKVDIYSLAMSFVFLFIYSRGSNVKKNISKIFSKSKKGTFLGDFKLLLKKMLDLNYKKRIEPPNAYIEFTRMINKEYPKSISLVKTKKRSKAKRSKAKRSKAKRSKAKKKQSKKEAKRSKAKIN